MVDLAEVEGLASNRFVFRRKPLVCGMFLRYIDRERVRERVRAPLVCGMFLRYSDRKREGNIEREREKEILIEREKGMLREREKGICIHIYTHTRASERASKAERERARARSRESERERDMGGWGEKDGDNRHCSIQDMIKKIKKIIEKFILERRR